MGDCKVCDCIVVCYDGVCCQFVLVVGQCVVFFDLYVVEFEVVGDCGVCDVVELVVVIWFDGVVLGDFEGIMLLGCCQVWVFEDCCVCWCLGWLE